MCKGHHHAHVSAHGHGSCCSCCCCCCCCGGTPHHEQSDCCEPAPHHHGGSCHDMEPGAGFRRRFVSREEKLAQLEAYLAALQAEAKAVEEKIARLRESE